MKNAITMTNNNKKPLIIASKTHEHIIARLISGAMHAFSSYNIITQDVVITKVSGALEIPLYLKHAAVKHDFNIFVVLALVLKGETDHYDHVSRLANDGVMSTALTHGLALGNGILCVHNIDQALKRSDESSHNAGLIAAQAAYSLYQLFNNSLS